MLDIEVLDQGLNVSYFDANGEILIKEIPLKKSDYYNWGYCEDNDKEKSKEFISWDKKPVKKIRSKYFDKYRIFELIDGFSEETHNTLFSTNEPKRAFLDIEVNVEDSFPDAYVTKEPVNTIAFVNDKGFCFCLGRKEMSGDDKVYVQNKINDYLKKFNIDWKFNYFYFESETEMLRAFFTKFLPKMSAVIGWNLLGYDYPYLYNRAKKLNLDMAVLSSPSGKSRELFIKDVGKLKFPYHKLFCDSMLFFKSATFNYGALKESTSLDWVATETLGVTKVHQKGTWKERYENFNEYVFYNVIDCCLNKLIEDKKKWFTTFITLGNIARVEANRVYSPVYTTERECFYELIKSNRLLIRTEHSKGKGYKGAYIMDPVRGLHEFVVTLDFASMYPELWAQYNCSPDVLLGKFQKGSREYFFNYNTNQIEKLDLKNHIFTEAGTIFSKNEDSVLRKVRDRLYYVRKEKKHIAMEIDVEINELENMLLKM